jgi:uracil phosphoribosyltransferase
VFGNKMKNITCLDHPILQQKLGQLRDKETPSYIFKSLLRDITQFMVYEAMRDLKLSYKTPLQEASVAIIDECPVIISIMRAGNGMLEAASALLPDANGGHIGIYRDHLSHNTIEYYLNLPGDVKGKTALLLDPIIGTGDTVIASIDRLKAFGVKRVVCLSVLGSKEGLAKITEIHSDVIIFVVGANDILSDNGFLLPGIGDAGDRIYNTN